MANRVLGLWVRISPGHGCLSVLIVVCCQVEVSATGWPVVQRSPTDCGASSCVIWKPLEWGATLNQLWLSINSRCITGCIPYMPLIVTVNTTAECLRTDCNILGDEINKETGHITPAITARHIWGSPSLVFNRHQRLFLQGVKLPGRESDDSPPSGVEIKTESISQYAFVAWRRTACLRLSLIS